MKDGKAGGAVIVIDIILIFTPRAIGWYSRYRMCVQDAGIRKVHILLRSDAYVVDCTEGPRSQEFAHFYFLRLKGFQTLRPRILGWNAAGE